jgi:hypothetical protein
VPTEWLKVMLEEIARKREDAASARDEIERRRGAREPLPPESSPSTTGKTTRASA